MVWLRFYDSLKRLCVGTGHNWLKMGEVNDKSSCWELTVSFFYFLFYFTRANMSKLESCRHVTQWFVVFEWAESCQVGTDYFNCAEIVIISVMTTLRPHRNIVSIMLNKYLNMADLWDVVCVCCSVTSCKKIQSCLLFCPQHRLMVQYDKN